MIRRALLALALALLVTAPDFIIGVRSSWHSPALLSDWDEAYYLALPYEASNVPLEALFSFEHGRLRAYNLLRSSLPHALSDAVVGKLAKIAALNPAQFGTLLDLIFFFASFLLLMKLFGLFNQKRRGNIGATLVSLLAPWLASISAYFSWRAGLPDYITVVSHQFFPSPPVFRGIYTQISQPLFFLSLWLLLREIVPKRLDLRWLGLSGFLAGLLIYLYFFAWLSLLAVAALMLSLDFCLTRHRLATSLRMFATRLGVFILPSLAAASFGLTALLSNGTIYAPGPDKSLAQENLLNFSGYYFFSPLLGLALIVFCALAFRFRHAQNRQTYTLLLIISSALLAEFLLMNLQPLLNAWVTPYHFSLFYLHPLISGSIVLLILNSFRERVASRAVVLIAFTVFIPTFEKAMRALGGEVSADSRTELLRELSGSQYEKSVVATMPFGQPFQSLPRVPVYQLLPYLIKTLSQRESLSQFMSFDAERIAFVRREFFLSWLYSGKLGPIAGCPSALDEVPTADIMLGAEAFHGYQRLVDCTIGEEILPKLEICTLLRENHVDYIVWEKQFSFARPTWFSELAQTQWRSTDGEFEIFNFDSVRAIERFCG